MTQSLIDTLLVARLLDLKTALPNAALIREHFNSREAVSESFRFNINCVSTSAFFDLGALLGDKNTQHLLQADGFIPATEPGCAAVPLNSKWIGLDDRLGR